MKTRDGTSAVYRPDQRPNQSVNPDAPSVWFLSLGKRQRRRTVERIVGAPVTLFR
jgi:hypothetical protein